MTGKLGRRQQLPTSHCFQGGAHGIISLMDKLKTSFACSLRENSTGTTSPNTDSKSNGQARHSHPPNYHATPAVLRTSAVLHADYKPPTKAHSRLEGTYVLDTRPPLGLYPPTAPQLPLLLPLFLSTVSVLSQPFRRALGWPRHHLHATTRP